MQTKHTEQSILLTFKLGLRGIFEASPKLLGIGSIIFSLTTTIITFIILIILKVPIYNILVDTKAQILSFLPGILGFSVGGYAFLIGFNQASLMNKISEPQEDSQFSLYQVASASFAITLLIQSFTLLIGYITHFIIQIDILGKISKDWNTKIITLINQIGLFILLSLLISSLFMIIQIIFNIFNFSQLYHYNVNKEKIDVIVNKKLDALKKEKIDAVL